MSWFRDVFGKEKVVIALVHFPPLPGTPFYDEKRGVEGIVEHVYEDLRNLQEGGIDAIMFGNEGDRPYATRVGSETVAVMAGIIGRLRNEILVPFGVDVLWDPVASFSVAQGTGASFVREVFTNVYASDMGLWNPNAGEALRHRRNIGAQHVRCFFNVNAEFAAPIGERPLDVVAKSVAFSSVPDGICVSGPMTGQPTNHDDLVRVREAVPADIPVVANTGVKVDTVEKILKVVDGAFVGTSLKRDGVTWNEVDAGRVRTFMDKVSGVR